MNYEIKSYLYFYTGEGNDAMRDRDFYIVHAQSKKAADAFLQYQLLMEDTEQHIEDYMPLVQADGCMRPGYGLGYGVQSMVEVCTPSMLHRYVNNFIDVWGSDTRNPGIEINPEGTFATVDGKRLYGIAYKGSDNEAQFTEITE